MVTSDPYPEAEFDGDWDESPQDWTPSPWRRRVIPVVTVVAVLAMLMLPFYSLIDVTNRPRAENGLEICDYDYCVIQDAVRDAGLGSEMSVLANTFLNDQEAAGFVQILVAHLGRSPVRFEVVDDLGGRTAGLYEPATRTIRVERPITAWILAHEAAHTIAGAHGIEFTRVLIEIVTWLQSGDAAQA